MKNVLLLLTIAYFISSCNALTEEERMKEEFDSAMMAFSKSVKELDTPVSKALGEITEDINALSSEKDIRISSLKNKWGKKGTSIANDLARIESEFNTTTEKMKLLFNLLESKAEESRENSLYEQMKQDGEDAKQRYEKKLVEAEKLFAELNELKKDIEGFGKVVEYYAILGEIEKGIRKVENLIMQLQDLKERLKTFSGA